MNREEAVVGAMMNNAWQEDPKRLAFTFARYKHVAKILSGRERVIEVGANAGFASRIVAAHVVDLTVTDADYYPGVEVWNPIHGQFLHGKFSYRPFDAAYALDVLEHVSPEQEGVFMRGIVDSLAPHGTLVIGMPSLESQTHASRLSKLQHVNCKTEEGLREVMEKFFHCVYLFGMNDETLHTGFGPMCHYRIAVANTKRAS